MHAGTQLPFPPFIQSGTAAYERVLSTARIWAVDYYLN